MSTQIILFSDVHHIGFMRSAGPYRIATELEKSYISCKVIPILSSILETNSFADFVCYMDPQIIGISTTFLKDDDIEKIEDQILVIRKKKKNIKIIIGGALAYRLSHVADVTIYGYADGNIVEIVKNLIDHKTTVPSKFVYDKFKDNFNFNSSQILYENIGIENEILPIEIARGCIFSCAFCSYPLNSKKKMDYLKYSNVLQEEFLDNFKNIGTTSYMFVDDTLNDSTVKIENLRCLFDKLPFKLTFTSYMRLDLLAVHTEQIDLLEGHVSSAFFGIESMNLTNAKLVGKGMPFERQVETAWKLKEKWKCHLTASFILGLPHDGRDAGEELLKFITSSNNPFDGVHIAPLSISKNPMIWKSKFEKNPEKFGYSLDKNNWTNSLNGLDRTYFVNQAKEINLQIRPVNRYGCWTTCALKNIGWDKFETHPTLSHLDHLNQEVKNLKNITLDAIKSKLLV